MLKRTQIYWSSFTLSGGKFRSQTYFYSGHCKELEPNYEEAAQLLTKAGQPVVFAKINAPANNKLAERFDIEGFPALFWFQ